MLYPAWNAAALGLQFGRITRQLARPGAYPSRARRQLVFDAALPACDALDGVCDGVCDGVASHVRACDAGFDLASATLNGTPLRCPGGVAGGDARLSDALIASFGTFDTPLTLGYPLASGETTYPGFTIWRHGLRQPGQQPAATDSADAAGGHGAARQPHAARDGGDQAPVWQHLLGPVGQAS